MANEYETQGGPVVPGPQAIHLPEDQDHPRAVPQDQPRTTSGPRTTADVYGLLVELNQRLDKATADYIRRQAQRKAERLQLETRRAHGLRARHAAKAARNREQP